MVFVLLTASDAVRHVVPSLQPDQMVRLLWQQDGFYFPGEWYLAGVGVVTETCSKQWTNSAACLQSLGTMDTWLVSVTVHWFWCLWIAFAGSLLFMIAYGDWFGYCKNNGIAVWVEPLSTTILSQL